jgi:hypothetical protein
MLSGTESTNQPENLNKEEKSRDVVHLEENNNMIAEIFSRIIVKAAKNQKNNAGYAVKLISSMLDVLKEEQDNLKTFKSDNYPWYISMLNDSDIKLLQPLYQFSSCSEEDLAVINHFVHQSQAIILKINAQLKQKNEFNKILLVIRKGYDEMHPLLAALLRLDLCKNQSIANYIIETKTIFDDMFCQFIQDFKTLSGISLINHTLFTVCVSHTSFKKQPLQ